MATVGQPRGGIARAIPCPIVDRLAAVADEESLKPRAVFNNRAASGRARGRCRPRSRRCRNRQSQPRLAHPN